MHMKVRQQGVCILIGRELHVKLIRSSKCLKSNSVLTNNVHRARSFNTVPMDMSLSYVNTFLSTKLLNIFCRRRCEHCTAGSTISRNKQGCRPLYGEFFSPMALQPNAGHGLLIVDEASRSHTTTYHSR